MLHRPINFLSSFHLIGALSCFGCWGFNYWYTFIIELSLFFYYFFFLISKSYVNYTFLSQRYLSFLLLRDYYYYANIFLFLMYLFLSAGFSSSLDYYFYAICVFFPISLFISNGGNYAYCFLLSRNFYGYKNCYNVTIKRLISY